MKLSHLAALAVFGDLAAAVRSPRHVGKRDFPQPRDGSYRRPQTGHVLEQHEKRWERPPVRYHKRAGETIIPQNKNTTRYAVDGTKIPDVHFDIGESYAGLMPISDKANESRELYFWFFPSKNPNATDEITIWLNGGPGCSSLEGFLQENGIFQWQYGTYQPVKNPYAWNKLTNMVWVEQPVGTGFSQGVPTATDEKQAAAQFLGFFKRFIDTFGLKGRKIFITGESYAGYYVPYIANAMFENGNKDYYNVEATMIYDPSTSYDVIQQQIPTLPLVEANRNLLAFNNSFMKQLTARDKSCGYADYREKYLVYPPKGPLPTPPQVDTSADCDVFGMAFNAASEINPCFDIYQIATTCPLLWDVLGFPGSFEYNPVGAPPVYFSRPEVQRAINAPVGDWAECSNGVLDTDNSPPSGLSVLPKVIEKSKRTIIGHATLDMILIKDGTLLMIQNMTWNGKQGFQEEPSTPFYVPFHKRERAGSLAGAGRFGTFRTERGLTFVDVILSGHMVPQYAPSAAFRQLEFLLGRIPGLGTHVPFTVSPV